MCKILISNDVSHCFCIRILITILYDENHLIAINMFLLCGKFHNLMKIILFLIIISISVALCFLAAFFWAVRDGQFDDEYTPSVRILLDDDMIDNNKNNS